MKTFEQFNENDPYEEEKWDEKPPLYMGDDILINGLLFRVTHYWMGDDGFYWYDLESEKDAITRREDVLNHIKHPDWSIQKCLDPSSE